MRRLLALALVAGLTGCGSQPLGAPAPTPTVAVTTTPAAPPSPTPSPRPAWVLGASPLPVGPDGFGIAGDTPATLRDRAFPTRDLLPPPPGGRWAASVLPVDDAVRRRMGTTWSPSCPVALADLRLLRVAFRGFDGAAHTGELVVAASVADDVVEVFRRLFAAAFPIEEVRLPGTADMEAAPTGDGNTTAGYVCRAARGQTRFSEHAFGTAVDVNPFHNPLVKGDLVLPELAGAYADRGDVRPGMHVDGGPAVAAFRAAGWTWGGDWRSSKDFMHFSLRGT